MCIDMYRGGTMSAEGMVKVAEKWAYLIWNAHSESVDDFAGVKSKVESAIREALQEYAASREEWVDVRERMPEPGVIVMVWVKIPNWTNPEDGCELDMIHKESRTWLTFHDDNVTHWRPLPQAPTEEAERG